MTPPAIIPVTGFDFALPMRFSCLGIFGRMFEPIDARGLGGNGELVTREYGRGQFQIIL